MDAIKGTLNAKTNATGTIGEINAIARTCCPFLALLGIAQALLVFP